MQREDRGAGERRRRRAGQRDDDPGERGDGATASDSDRDRDAGRAGAIPGIDLHRERVQQVRQRQPDGADLLPAGREAVEDAARDDQMAARVVVAQRRVPSGW